MLIFKIRFSIPDQKASMLITKNSVLKRRYKMANIFRAISILSVIFCLTILVVFITSVAKSAVMPLYAVDVPYNKNIAQFIENNLKHKNLYNYFPKSERLNILQAHENDSTVIIPIKYEFKQYFLKDIITNESLVEDYAKLKEYIIKNNLAKRHINWNFFKKGDAVHPESAGIKAAIVGSLFVLAVFCLITVPCGILVGLYISEFIPPGKWRGILQINIQNLASIPSIIYGIIVLNICINGFGLTRSSALVGGITLSLLILPMIVMITYNAASMVSQGYKDSSLALGLSDVQTAFIITLPLAMPRIITGILLAIARAAGETAPLIIIGMAFFASNVPHSITSDAATTLPLQIFLWTSNPKEAFIEYASAAILIFVLFLTMINMVIHYIRGKISANIS